MPRWQMRSARLTVFVAPDVTASATLWRDVLGEEPESSLTQRAIATRIDSGPFADGKLNLQVQPIRVDWVHEPLDEELFKTEMSSLGEFPDSAGPLLKLAQTWLGVGFPAAQRIALGFVLMFPSADRESAYDGLKQFIDGVPKAADTTDFSYQVNRPRASNTPVEGLRINRLSKWSVGAFRSVAISPAAAAPIVGEMRYHLRLELDVNTAPDFTAVLPKEHVGRIIDALLQGAIEISEKGNRF